MFGRTRPPRGGGGGGDDDRFGGRGGDDRERRPPRREGGAPFSGPRQGREGQGYGDRDRGSRGSFGGSRPPFDRGGGGGGFNRGGPPFRDREERPRFEDRPRFGERQRSEGEGDGGFAPRAPRPAPQQAPKPAQPRKVVYQVVTMGEEDTGEELERRLNTLGRDGWRLVAIDEGRQYVFMTIE